MDSYKEHMTNIIYTYHHGSYIGIWPGKSIRKDGQPRKIGQIYLGKVIDKEKNIFWTRDRGFYTFNPDDQSIGEVASSDVPPVFTAIDKRKGRPPVIVDFGDSYFLHELIYGIGYNTVLDAIKYQNRDSLYSAISYYTLEASANCHAESWYRQNYASFLYPRAKIETQSFSSMLTSIGKEENVRNFLLSHIHFLTAIYGGDLCILIDSSGVENDCDLPVTRIRNHNGDINLEFRLILVVQKSTGIPFFYEYVPGNIIDASTLKRIVILFGEYKCRVDYRITDAEYSCPSNIERLILSGIEFMYRLSPNYKLYKDVIQEHLAELDDDRNVVRFKDRLVHIIKISSVIAKDKESKECTKGFVYLCKDIQSSQSKRDHLLSSNYAETMTVQELLEVQKKFGVFAIVATRDLPVEQILPEYYQRKSAEQYFDYGKNYAKFLPVRQQSMETLAGHLLLSFIASFFVILVKNRMKLLDVRYVAAPPLLAKNEDGEDFLEQDPLLEVFDESPATLFCELRGQKADVFQSRIVPSCPTKRANDFYRAFAMKSPLQVYRIGEKLKPKFDSEGNNVNKPIVDYMEDNAVAIAYNSFFREFMENPGVRL